MANINSIIYKGVKYNIGDSYLVGGSGDVDLTGYATNDYVDEQIAGLNFDCNWDESRIAALEELVNQLNTRIDNISSGGSGSGSDDEGGGSSEEPIVSSFVGITNNGVSYSVKINGNNETVESGARYIMSDDVTNMNGMFYFCYKLTSLDLSNFNTSKVTNISSMFHNCSGLTSLDLSNFDTSNVTNMADMFGYCSGFTSLDLSNFNTSKVTDMTDMFRNCTGLTSLDLRNFDTSNVADMDNMFLGCTNLTKIYCSQAFYKWCINNRSTIGINETPMKNGTVGDANEEGADYNWMIYDYVEDDIAIGSSYTIYCRDFNNWENKGVVVGILKDGDTTIEQFYEFDDGNIVKGFDTTVEVEKEGKTATLYKAQFELLPPESGYKYFVLIYNLDTDELTEGGEINDNYVYGDGDPVAFDDYVPGIDPKIWTGTTCTVDLTIYDKYCNIVTSDYELDMSWWLTWTGEDGQRHSSEHYSIGNGRQLAFNPVELGIYGTASIELEVSYGDTAFSGYFGGGNEIDVNAEHKDINYTCSRVIIKDESIKKTIYFYDINQQSTWASLCYWNNGSQLGLDGSAMVNEVDGVAHTYFKFEFYAENFNDRRSTYIETGDENNYNCIDINNWQDGYIYTSDENSYPFDEFVWLDVPEYEVLIVNGTGTLNYTQNGEAKTLELTGEETTLSTTLATPITLTSFNGAALTKLNITNSSGCRFDDAISTPADFFTPSKSILTMAYVGSMRYLTWRNAFNGFSALVKLDFGPSTNLGGVYKSSMGTGTNISTICCGYECFSDLAAAQHIECDLPFATDDSTYTVGAIGSGANYELYDWEDEKDGIDQSHWIEQPE